MKLNEHLQNNYFHKHQGLIIIWALLYNLLIHNAEHIIYNKWDSNKPCVSILVAQFLFHFSVRQRFQVRAPLIDIHSSAKGNFDWRQRVLTERVRFLVPVQLAAYTVSDGRNELSTKTQLSAQRERELLRVVKRIWHVPFELVLQWNVPNVQVQLD